jgi:L-cysteine desulfidase
MERGSLLYNTYVEILRRELVCAQGCTEPIAIAYCAAVARSVLGALPERIEVEASGNIIKNVKSVVVPGTGGRRGIAAAAAIGVLGGDETAQLEVIKTVPQEAKDRLESYLKATPITLIPVDRGIILDIAVTACRGDSYAKVRIVNEHTNIVLVEKDGQILQEKSTAPEEPAKDAKRVHDISERIDELKPVDKLGRRCGKQGRRYQQSQERHNKRSRKDERRCRQGVSLFK